ncbi:expressed unknown protein [Seminavis robusta]|uniref:Uncharacterized protein n=1 Tax=Seminavis robusta TaxID=568900 RepID=A0A9N8DMH4_9STRA|nr:expressed unknown protein [Seminavis robusta]|eukprot:Sro225_g091890.1 n/a (154) ;mRNA; r:74322-74783
MQTGNREVLNRLDVVWRERNCSVVRGLLQELSLSWAQLVAHYGPEASKVCRLSIYVTGEDTEERRELAREVEKVLPGRLKTGRARFDEILENHTIELAKSESRQSVTLLTYCGGSNAKKTLREAKIRCDLLAAATGNEKHQMDFVAENFGPGA